MAEATQKGNKSTQPVYVQLHMRGANEIAEVFGVSRDTVIKWAKAGAPIRVVGKKYQAQYGQLWDWILENTEEERPRRDG